METLLKVRVTELHLDKALQECPLPRVENCLVAQAVATAMGVPVNKVSAGRTQFGPYRVLRGQERPLVTLIDLFDSRDKHPKNIAKLRSLLPREFDFELNH